VVTEPVSDQGNYTSYMAASYVKWIESAGARVVPLRYDAPEENEKLMKGLNGLLYPGGGASLAEDSAFFQGARSLWESALKSNQAGEYFPVWGTCLGFELLGILGAGQNYGANHSVLVSGFDSEDYAIPLNYTKSMPDSRLFKQMIGMSKEVVDALGRENITINMHSSGVLAQEWESNAAIADFYTLIASNNDRKGRTFASVIEGKKYPVYGTQFHPEKNNFEWVQGVGIPHTYNAVAASQGFADFFVEEAWKSSIVMEKEALEKVLIYNYDPVYTGREDSEGHAGYFQQTYYF